MTAGAADSKIRVRVSNQPVTFESTLIGIVRFEFESNLEASLVRRSLLILRITKYDGRLPEREITPSKLAAYVNLNNQIESK